VIDMNAIPAIKFVVPAKAGTTFGGVFKGPRHG
jgi:hypothetical protein